MPRGKPVGRYTPSRRSRNEGEGGSQAWLTTYADAVTLLMAFFVLLYAMSEIDVVKFTAFLEGLRVPFGNESGEGLLPQTDGLQPEQEPTPPITEEQRPERPDRLREVTQDVLEQLDEQAAAREQLDVIAVALDGALAEAELERYVDQRREERGLVVSIASDDILFALGSTHINKVGLQVIKVVSQTLQPFPNPLMVEGHTDNVPLDRGGYTNWNLSTDRAVAVLSLMIESHKLPPDRVGAVGYGEYHPLADNKTSRGRSRNRRVDIVVLVEENML